MAILIVQYCILTILRVDVNNVLISAQNGGMSTIAWCL